MDDGYKNTVAGLLRKRAEMLDEVRDCRERLAMLTNDLEGIERVLETLGYDGELPTQSTRQAKVILFYRNELRSWIKSRMREVGRPVTSREIAETMIDMEGKDVRDRRLRNDLVRRVSKALRQMRDAGQVTAERQNREYLWALVQPNVSV